MSVCRPLLSSYSGSGTAERNSLSSFSLSSLSRSSHSLITRHPPRPLIPLGRVINNRHTRALSRKRYAINNAYALYAWKRYVFRNTFDSVVVLLFSYWRFSKRLFGEPAVACRVVRRYVGSRARTVAGTPWIRSRYISRVAKNKRCRLNNVHKRFERGSRSYARYTW